MCLAVPGRLVEIQGEGDVRMGRIDFGGVVRQACLAYLPEAEPGDYVLVHVGFAISRIDEQAARETLEALRQIGEMTVPDEMDAGASEAPDAIR
jgi:hydrogenase expression/formation protein HypC